MGDVPLATDRRMWVIHGGTPSQFCYTVGDRFKRKSNLYRLIGRGLVTVLPTLPTYIHILQYFFFNAFAINQNTVTEEMHGSNILKKNLLGVIKKLFTSKCAGRISLLSSV